MAITLESAQRLTALKNKIDGVTNIESETLAEAIDNALVSCANEDGLITRTIAEYKNDKITSIGPHAFHDCSSLISVNVPLVTSIGVFAFSGCTSLISVKFPLVTSIVDCAFFGCSKLTSIDLPLVTSIEDSTFSDCSSLVTVILRSDSVCALGGIDAFMSTPIASGTGYIYVPSALVDTYKAASNWSTYANQFRALEDYTVDGTTTGALDETKIGASGESGA